VHSTVLLQKQVTTIQQLLSGDKHVSEVTQDGFITVLVAINEAFVNQSGENQKQ
jgi:hypothetical protein